MTIRFKCPHCQKPLAVKDELAGKRATCPACKKPIVIPAPLSAPADVEEFAAAALSEQPAAVKDDKPPEFVEFDCPFCGDPVKVGIDLAGKNAPCPACKHIVKVPLPKVDKPKDWRDVNKNGPAAARMNLPEQLEGAWGTEAKSRVARDTLEEAGALPEFVESIGIGGWIRRVVVLGAVAGVITLIVVAASRNRIRVQLHDVIKEAREFAEKMETDPKKKLHPILRALIEQADGELLLRQGKREPARIQFLKARKLCTETAKEGLLDQDLFLIDLAFTQLEMGGTKDQVYAYARYEWEVVLVEVSQTQALIKEPQARIMAVRDWSSELITLKQVPLALNLAAKLTTFGAGELGKGATVSPQQVALIFAHGDTKMLAGMLKPPDLKAPERTARQGYAEGHARKGNLEEAKKLVYAPGQPVEQFEAAVGVANVLLADKSNKDNCVAQAAPFVADAFELHKKLKNVNPWLALQLCRAAYRIPDHSAAAKDIAAKLPANFKRRVQLEAVQVQLERGDDKASMELVKEFPDAEGPSRGLAWVALARQLTQLGRPVQLPEAEGEDAVYRVFANIGIALGKQDREK